MIDHVFLTVSDLDRSTYFYTKALAPLGIVERFDYERAGTALRGIPTSKASAPTAASLSG